MRQNRGLFKEPFSHLWVAGCSFPSWSFFYRCDKTPVEIVGRKGGDYSGIAIPYFHPGSDQVRDYRLRRDHPDLEYDAGGNPKIKQKYLSPPGRSNMLYLPPGAPPSLLRDRALPIIITEGEFKTLALWRAASYGGTSGPGPRFLPVGVSGVYNWRGSAQRVVCGRKAGCGTGSVKGTRLEWRYRRAV